jgi:hypothetical protein
LWLGLEIRRRTRRDINIYNRTYISLYILPELFKGYKGRDRGDIKHITFKDPSGILSIKRLIILPFNVFKVKNVFRVLYTFKLDFRPGS